MVCQGLEIMSNDSIANGTIVYADYFVYPTTCMYNFYSVILFVIFVLIAYALFNSEKETFVKADIISSLGVAGTVTFFLAMIMTLVKSTNNIPMLQQDLFLIVAALWIVISAIWFFKR